MPLVIACPVCATVLLRGDHECTCGTYRLHPFAPGHGGVLVLFGKHQIWMWHDETPTWVLHYERPEPPRRRVRRRRH